MDDELEVINLFNDGMKATNIAKKVGVSYNAINKVLKDNNLTSRGVRKLDGFDEEIKDAYLSGEHISSIAKRFGVGYALVRLSLQRIGTEFRKHDCSKYWTDHNFFDCIDTEIKAYIFGLLCGDGYNHEKYGNILYRVSDPELVSTVRDALSPNRPIRTYKNYRGDKFATITGVDIGSRKLSTALAEAGCGQGKSATLEFPSSVPIEMLHHFVRGYFDADGSVFQVKNTHRLGISIIATRIFCDHLATVIPVNSYIRDRTYTNMSDLRINNQRDVLLFRDWLYRDANFFLKRKRDMFYSIEVGDGKKAWVYDNNGVLTKPRSAHAGKNKTAAQRASLSEGWKKKATLEYKGEKMPMSTIAKMVGKHSKTIRQYSKRHNLSIQEAIDHYIKLNDIKSSQVMPSP